ncbi:hypothetical protein QNE81_003755 [Vibrio vulnificus]|nr:hypothetical protein [Vibrio vulnificus]
MNALLCKFSHISQSYHEKPRLYDQEIAKTKEPNSVHVFAEAAMLQTKLQQAKDSDD